MVHALLSCAPAFPLVEYLFKGLNDRPDLRIGPLAGAVVFHLDTLFLLSKRSRLVLSLPSGRNETLLTEDPDTLLTEDLEQLLTEDLLG